jgi:hypothetical protein
LYANEKGSQIINTSNCLIISVGATGLPPAILLGGFKSQAFLATLEPSFSSNQSTSKLAIESIKKPPPVGESL